MDAITSTEIVIYTVVNFGAALLSGIAGGGAGFITTPLLVILGLTPAQSVATGKLAGVAISLGSIGGLKGVKRTSRKRMIKIVILALVIGLLAPQVIVRLDSELYRKLLGLLLLAMIPVLILKKVGLSEHEPTRQRKAVGYGLLILSFGLVAVFSGGLGVLVNLVLMSFLGMPAIEASLTKRYSGLILTTVVALGVLGSGLIVWPIALIGMVTSGAGGYVGGKIAVKKGNTFVMSIFIVLMLISALELLLG